MSTTTAKLTLTQLLLLFSHSVTSNPPVPQRDYTRTPPKGVICNSYAPHISAGNVAHHENDTVSISLTTDVRVELEQSHKACIEVDLEHGENSTSAIDSIFYTFRYDNYEQHYSVEEYFEFGIPEFRSDCKCDCEKGDSICSFNFGNKYCSDGVACVQTYYPYMGSHGCQYSGAASVCCRVSVRPFRDEKYTAVKLKQPVSTAALKINIYVMFKGKWSLFRHYTERITLTGNSYLHLNGNDNVAEVDIRAKGDHPNFELPTWDKYFVYVHKNGVFKLMDNPVSNYRPSGIQYYKFLEYRRGRWNVHNALGEITSIHSVQVTNCKSQRYNDRYNLRSVPFVIRNSTGAINWEPKDGVDLRTSHRVQIGDISLVDDDAKTVIVKLRQPPSLDLRIKLEQKLNVVTHVHASYLDGFVAKIRLDKSRDRFLNITLINAFGTFSIQFFKDAVRSKLELSLGIKTSVPLSMNHTHILPLPGFISENRFVCIYPDGKSTRAVCHWTLYEMEPVETYRLPNPFSQTEGNCPGCNEYEQQGFFSFLNPRNWFKGITSIPEGIAIGLEVVLYVIILIVVIAIFRRCLWPVIRWALCAQVNQTSYPRKEKFDEKNIVEHL